MTKPDALWRRCANLFMVGFDGTEPPSSMHALIDDGVFGAILFKRNGDPPARVASLVRSLKQRAGRPFVLAVDQEGGRVARLRGAPFTALPPMRELGRRDAGGILRRYSGGEQHEERTERRDGGERSTHDISF